MPIDVIDYSNTVFYKIYCKDATIKDLYVGHTTNFVQRKYAHKRTCIKEKDANHHLKVYKCIRGNGGWDNWIMDIIGFRNCYDHYEARKVEQNYFETLKATLNSIEPLPKPKPIPTPMPKEKQEKRVWHCDVCNTTCETNNALIIHQETKKHKRNSVVNTSNNICDQKPKMYVCEKCDFKCSKNSNYNKHLLTEKHKIFENAKRNEQKKPLLYKCSCGKQYKHNQSYYRHKGACAYTDTLNNDIQTSAIIINDNSTILDLISQNKELMNLLITKNHQMDELIQHNKELQNIGNNNTPITPHKTTINKVMENITKNSGIIE